MIEEKFYKINDYITLRLESKKTNIYLNKELSISVS